MLRCFHKPTTSLFFSLLVFQQLRFSPFFSLHSFISTGGIVILLSSNHLLVLSRSSSFLAYPFNRSVVSSLQFLFILSSFPSLFYRSAVQILSFLFLGYLIIPRWSYSFCSWSSYFHVFQHSSSRNTPCSSFLMDWLQSRSSLLYSFFYIAQPLKVHGFTRLSKKQLSLPLIFLFLFHLVPS